MLETTKCEHRRCIHLKGVIQPDGTEATEIWNCKAFPSGIPAEISYGKNLHTKPVKGDHGIQFEKAESKETKDSSALDIVATHTNLVQAGYKYAGRNVALKGSPKYHYYTHKQSGMSIVTDGKGNWGYNTPMEDGFKKGSGKLTDFLAKVHPPKGKQTNNAWTDAARRAARANKRGKVLLHRGMSQEEYKEFQKTGEIKASKYNNVSEDPETAQFYAKQHDDPGVVIRFYGPKKNLEADELYKGDYKVHTPFKVRRHIVLNELIENKWTDAAEKARWAGHVKMVPAKRIGEKKEAKIVLESGEQAPSHIKVAMVPAKWTDVKINLDPNGHILVIGRDEKGREQKKYHPEFTSARAVAKFARTRELLTKHEDVLNEIKSHLTHPDAKVRENAHAAWLIHERGVRPGSERETGGAKKAYGATTLKAEHVQQYSNGDTRLSFVGKKGVRNIHRITGDLGKMLQDRAKAAGKGKLFNTNDSQLRDYVKKLDGGGFLIKDLRTARGTAIAREIVGDRPRRFYTEREFKQAQKRVAEKVAAVLNNKWQESLRSYIDPDVFQLWSIVPKKTVRKRIRKK